MCVRSGNAPDARILLALSPLILPVLPLGRTHPGGHPGGDGPGDAHSRRHDGGGQALDLHGRVPADHALGMLVRLPDVLNLLQGQA